MKLRRGQQEIGYDNQHYREQALAALEKNHKLHLVK